MKRYSKMLALAVIGLGLLACTGGSAYVGVYGAPMYGPSPWGGYPGRYGPYGPYGGGGVWVGVPVCCEEQEEQDQPQEQPELLEAGPEGVHDGTYGDGTSESGTSDDHLREHAPR